jgi:hypothetical protein
VRRGLTFGDLAQHYAEHELVECFESIRPKAHTTIKSYERVLRNRLLPRWGNRIALGIEPLEVEQWLRTLKKDGDLANPTLDKTRRVMSLVHKHGQRYGLIPRSQESNPMRFVRCKTTSGYEAMILSPEQAYAIVSAPSHGTIQRSPAAISSKDSELGRRGAQPRREGWVRRKPGTPPSLLCRQPSTRLIGNMESFHRGPCTSCVGKVSDQAYRDFVFHPFAIRLSRSAEEEYPGFALSALFPF